MTEGDVGSALDSSDSNLSANESRLSASGFGSDVDESFSHAPPRSSLNPMSSSSSSNDAASASLLTEVDIDDCPSFRDDAPSLEDDVSVVAEHCREGDGREAVTAHDPPRGDHVEAPSDALAASLISSSVSLTQSLLSTSSSSSASSATTVFAASKTEVMDAPNASRRSNASSGFALQPQKTALTVVFSADATGWHFNFYIFHW